MSRGLLLPFVCLFATVATGVVLPLVLRAEDPEEPNGAPTGSATEPYLVQLKKADTGVVIRSAEELVAHSAKPGSAKDAAVQKEMEGELAKFLKVERIDWKKQMIVAVQGHPSNGAQGHIKFDPAVKEGNVLVVSWRQVNHVTRAPYSGPPVGFALLERFEGDVTLRPRNMNNSLGMDLLLLPRGKFLMGSPKDEEDRVDEEFQHEVEITQPFYVCRYEVTVGDFKAFVKDTKYQTEAEKDGKGGRGFDGKEFTQRPEVTWKKLYFTQYDSEPVTVVSWNDAVAFCEWLSKKEGRTYRLPTEAEWEYACRAGTKTRFNTGEKEDDLKVAGNIADASLRKKWKDAFWAVEWDDGYPFTSVVGRFKANAWGLNDMHGNAWEWCSDWYAEDYYRKSPKQDPQGPATGKQKVARGGAWSTQPKFCRSAFRDMHEPTYRSDCVGFRVVVSVGK